MRKTGYIYHWSSTEERIAELEEQVTRLNVRQTLYTLIMLLVAVGLVIVAKT